MTIEEISRDFQALTGKMARIHDMYYEGQLSDEDFKATWDNWCNLGTDIKHLLTSVTTVTTFGDTQ
jgi:hypothetical protein